MVINVVAAGAKLTGGTLVVMKIINGLAARGHQVNLLTFGEKRDLDWIDLKANVYYANRTMMEKIAGWLFRSVFGFQAWPEEETRKLIGLMPPCDINLSTISYMSYAVTRSHVGIPFQLFMHYEPFLRPDGYKNRIIEETYFLPARKIVNSSWLKRIIQERTRQDNIHLVFPAIDHEVFYPRRQEKTINAQGKIVVASLAKDKVWKGFSEALKAVQLVRARGYDIDFQAFGNRFDKAALSADASKVSFQFVGPKKELALGDFYDQADILISASYFESFPLPPLEAMASGTPVVTTQFGTEDYAVDRKTAMVVPPKQPAAMADAIIELIEHKELYQTLRSAGIKKAQEFTWDATTDAVETLFLDTLNEQKTISKDDVQVGRGLY